MISIKDYTIEEIDDILDYAVSDFSLRGILKGRSICMWFAEPSTRTRLSFEIAANYCGADVYHVGDNSAVKKGESIYDTVRTLDALGFDALVVRSAFSHTPIVAREISSMKVINAGNGRREHPTQALTDLYTLQRYYGFGVDLKDTKVAIVGDVISSRVARSIIHLFSLYNIQVALVEDKLSGYSNVERFSSVDEACKWADVIYMLRTQTERGSEFSGDPRYQFRLEHFDRFNDIVLMHPGPVNVGDEIVEDECITYGRSLISDQVKNGIQIRKAVLATELM